MNARKVYCNQLFHENVKRPLHFDIFVLTPLYGVRFILEFNRQTWHNHLCQFVTNLLFYRNLSQTLFFWKIIFLFCSLMKHFIVLSRNYCEGESAFFFATWSFSPRALSRTYETFVLSCQRGKQAWGARRRNVCNVVKQLSRYFKTCETCKLSNALSPKPLAMFMTCYENIIIIIHHFGICFMIITNEK